MRKKRSNKKAIIITSVILVCILSVIVFNLINQSEKPINVTFANAERRTITQIVSATGKIQPKTKVKISSEVSGEIVTLDVKEGDYVAKGKLLAKINPAILETQLEQQEAMVAASRASENSIQVQMLNLETELKRAKELYAKSFISKQELDKAQTLFDATVADYNAALSRTQSTEANLKQI